MSFCPDAARDPEAPWPPAPPAPSSCACSPLLWLLGTGLLLVAATSAACVVRLWVWPVPLAALGPAPSPRTPEGPKFPPDALAGLPVQQQGMFAQLVARNVLLTDGPLRWYSDPGLAGVSLAPGLSYDDNTQELVVAEPGIYYVFLQLGLQRVVAYGGRSGSVALALHLQPLTAGAAALALTVDLPSQTQEALNSAFGFRGRLLHLGAGQRLVVHLRAQAEARSCWQLAQGATVLGLFRVSAEVPDSPPSP